MLTVIGLLRSFSWKAIVLRKVSWFTLLVAMVTLSCRKNRWPEWLKECIFLRHLTLSRRRPLSYRNQSIDLLCKSMGWFLYENSLRHERVKALILRSAHQRNVQENKQCSMQTVITLALKEIYAYVFTNKSVNCVYITRRLFCIFAVLSCIKGLEGNICL